MTREEKAARALPCTCTYTAEQRAKNYHEPRCLTHRRKDVERELESLEVALKANHYAWCVEEADSPPDHPVYLCVQTRGFGWSTNWRQALRFARFCDALDVSRTLNKPDGAFRIAEHGFNYGSGEIVHALPK